MIKKVSLGRGAPTLRVGILGLTNPGVAIWDRGNVEGKLRFDDMVATAAKWVPMMRARGADLVLISAHGGDSGTSSYGPELPNENPAALIAQQVPGIDAILFGHAHNEVPQRFVTNERDRRAGAALRAVEVGPAADPDGLHAHPRARPVDDHQEGGHHAEHQHCGRGPEGARRRAGPAPEDRRVRQPGRRASPPWSCRRRSRGTRTRRSWTSSTRCRPRRSARRWPARRTPTCRCCRSRRRSAGPRVFPAGDVKIKDVAGLYMYDNTLEAVVLTGAEVRAYLEYSAKYFRTLAPGAPVDPAKISDPAVPDYNYDVFSGVDYDIDISKPVGQRITRLLLPGTARRWRTTRSSWWR